MGRQRLFGLETEYAITCFRGEWLALPPQASVNRFMQRAGELPHLPARWHSGLFLENGGLLYADGLHPEMATPEVSTPGEACRYVKAGDALVEEIGQRMIVGGSVDRVLLSRSNVSYGPHPATWSCHESISHSVDNLDRLANDLIPHLVSRVVYTGEGGFDNDPMKGIRRMISPRVRYLCRPRSEYSTDERGIFHDKHELLDEQQRRLHIIASGSLYGERGLWLKLATTVCVVALIEAKQRSIAAVRLRDPVAAMDQIARDPTLTARVELESGAKCTALDIQQHYLECVERGRNLAEMPAWVGAACHAWRQMLQDLRRGPAAVARKLDWSIKLHAFTDFLEVRGFSWDDLEKWNQVLERLARIGRQSPEAVDFCHEGWRRLQDRSRFDGQRRLIRQILRDLKLDAAALERVIRLRQELFELDARFGILGPDGLFTVLDRESLLDVASPEPTERVAVDTAKTTPPPTGRPRVRGEAVRQLQGDREHYWCDWSLICGPDRVLDLSDPFTDTLHWSPLRSSGDSARDVPLRPTLAQTRTPRRAADSERPRRRRQASLPRRGDPGPAPPNHGPFDVVTGNQGELAEEPTIAGTIFAYAYRNYEQASFRRGLATLGLLSRDLSRSPEQDTKIARLKRWILTRLGERDPLAELGPAVGRCRTMPFPEILDAIYQIRFGRIWGPDPAEILGFAAPWLEAGVARLGETDMRSAALFREHQAFFALLAENHAEVGRLLRMSLSELGRCLLGERIWSRGLVTLATSNLQSRGPDSELRLLRLAEEAQTDNGYLGDLLELTIPAQARVTWANGASSPDDRERSRSMVAEALDRISRRENPLAVLRLKRILAEFE